MSLLSNFFNSGTNGPSNPFFGIMNLMQKIQLFSRNPIEALMSMNPDWKQSFQQFSQNPVESLISMNPNIRIPQNLINNPEGAVRYLINSGQMSQEEFSMLGQTVNQCKNLFPKF